MARAVLLIAVLEDEHRRREKIENRRLRRNLRISNFHLALSDSEFRAHYRLSKEVFSQLCEDLRPHLEQARRTTKISIECKILTALSFYATGSYQKPVGMSYMHKLSQASVSNALREVTMALNHPDLLTKYIRFPQTRPERQTIINRFSNKFGIPGVLGCIDGTHVALIQPKEDSERFFNRKRYYSRNVQIVCDSDLNILNVHAIFGGAADDAYIWKSCMLHDHMQDLHRDGESVWLLGDSGYPLRPWLLTPIVKAERGSPDEHYTRVHSRARDTVDRCIKVLKARWRCLLAHKKLHYDHHMVARIINACVVLHNMCNRNGIPFNGLSREDEEEDRSRQVPSQYAGGDASGRRQRAIIVQRLWRAK